MNKRQVTAALFAALFLFAAATPALAGGRGLKHLHSKRVLIKAQQSTSDEASGWGVSTSASTTTPDDRTETSDLYDKSPLNPTDYIVSGTTSLADSFDFPSLLNYLDKTPASVTTQPLSIFQFLGNLFEAIQQFLNSKGQAFSSQDLQSTSNLLSRTAVNLAEGKVSSLIPTSAYTDTIRNIKSNIATLQAKGALSEDDQASLEAYQEQLAELSSPEVLQENAEGDIRILAQLIVKNQAEIAALEGQSQLTEADTEQLSLLKQVTDSFKTLALSGLKTIIAASASVDGVRVGINLNSVVENGVVDTGAVLNILSAVSADTGAAPYIRETSSYERPGQTTTDPAANEANQQQQQDQAGSAAENASGGTTTDPVVDPVVTTTEGENGSTAAGGDPVVVDPVTNGGEGGEGGAP